MRREDIIAFARRDWAAVEEHKRRHWAAQASTMSAEELLRVGDDLRRHMVALHPTWPSAEERQSDLAVHSRVAESLRSVDTSRRR